MELAGVPAYNGTSIYQSWGNPCWWWKYLPMYGYGICGLRVSMWKLGLQWNRSKRRQSEILDSYFTFPVQVVGVINLGIQEHLKRVIKTHNKLLRWWLGKYIPSFVKDLTDSTVVHRFEPCKWRTTWQQAVSSYECLLSHLPVFFWHSHTICPEEELEIEDLDITFLEEQPACSLIGAGNEGETLQQDDSESHGDGKSTEYIRWNHRLILFYLGICQGITKSNIQCRKKVKIG